MNKPPKTSTSFVSRKFVFIAMVPTIIALHFGFSIFGNMQKNVKELEKSDLPFYKYETKFDVNQESSKGSAA